MLYTSTAAMTINAPTRDSGRSISPQKIATRMGFMTGSTVAIREAATGGV